MTLLSALAMNACGKEETKEPEKDAPMTSSEYISFKVSASRTSKKIYSISSVMQPASCRFL